MVSQKTILTKYIIMSLDIKQVCRQNVIYPNFLLNVLPARVRVKSATEISINSFF